MVFTTAASPPALRVFTTPLRDMPDVCYDDRVRRVPAILLLALFSFSLLMETLSATYRADSSAYLPECCRRAGKHHCSVASSGDADSSGPTFKAQPHCPMYPRVLLYSRNVRPADITSGCSLNPPSANSTFHRERPQPRPAVVRIEAHYLRGPPSLA
jgi:hypothetical protein